MGWLLDENQWCCNCVEWYNRSMAPVSRSEHFTEHGVRHGTDTEPVRRRRHHERGEQNSLKARLAGQLGDRGQDGADAEEGGGHDGGEGDKLGNSIHPVASERW